MNEINCVTDPKYSKKRPDERKLLTPKKLKDELNNEIDIAVHSLKLNLINNAPWIAVIAVILIVCLFIDFYTCIVYWKNPAILFKQIKIVFSHVIAFILGIVADYIRRKIVKFNH